MKRTRRASRLPFTDHQAMCWAVSAYLDTTRAERRHAERGERLNRSEFAERFIAELQARIYLHGQRQGDPIYLDSLWDLDVLAASIDPGFVRPEVNDLPEPSNAANNAAAQGGAGG